MFSSLSKGSSESGKLLITSSQQAKIPDQKKSYFYRCFLKWIYCMYSFFSRTIKNIISCYQIFHKSHIMILFLTNNNDDKKIVSLSIRPKVAFVYSGGITLKANFNPHLALAKVENKLISRFISFDKSD